MTKQRKLILWVVALVLLAAFLVWWPALLQGLQGMHGSFGPQLHGG